MAWHDALDYARVSQAHKTISVDSGRWRPYCKAIVIIVELKGSVYRKVR